MPARLPIALLLLLLGGLAGAATGLDRSSCVAEQERLDALREQLARQEQWRDQLQALRRGDVASDVPLELLFVVNLDDAEAVTARAASLAGGSARPASPDAGTGCAKLSVPLRETAETLASAAADVDVLRLGFLRLPAAARERVRRVYRLTAELQGLQQSLEAADAALQSRLATLADETVSTPGTEQARERLALDDERARIEAMRAALANRRDSIATLRTHAGGLLAIALSADPDGHLPESRGQALLGLWRDSLAAPLHAPGGLPAVPADADTALQDAGSLAKRLSQRIRPLGTRLLHEATLLRGELHATAGLRELYAGQYERLPADLLLEVREMPLQFALPALETLSGTAQDGRPDWATLSARVARGVSFLAMVAAAVWVGRRVTVRLVSLHDRIIAHVRGRSTRDWLGAVLRTLAPFTPWLVALATTLGAVRLLGPSEGLVLWLLPLVLVYLAYRLLCLLLEGAASRLHAIAGAWLPAVEAQRLSRSARRHAALLALLLLLRHVVLETVGPALLWQLLAPVSLLLAWLLLAWYLRPLREVMGQAAANALVLLDKPLVSAGTVARLLGAPGGALLAPPLAVVTLLGSFLNFVHAELMRIDGYRRLVLRSVRLRLAAEAVGEQRPGEEHHRALSAAYLAGFRRPAERQGDLDAALPATTRLAALIDDWASGASEENSAAVVGDPGMGKSNVLDALARQHEQLRVCRLTPDVRLTRGDALLAQLAVALGEELPEGLDSLVANDVQRPPTLLLVDDAQHLFLASVGGLDAWRTLLAAVNLPLANLFWCVAVNTQPWLYLSDIFGSRYQFRHVVRLKGWSQNEIRTLVLARNGNTGFQLRYDDVLMGGAGAGEAAAGIRSAEQRFFGLLWDASRGNPSLALELWEDAVSPIGEHLLSVGTPPAPQMPGLPGDETLFVLRALARHGGLREDDIVRTTDLPLPVVRHGCKQGVDSELTLTDAAGRHHLRLRGYYPLIAHLTAKNMLHD